MDINIGDVFYKIERTKFQTFRSECRICEGAGKVSVKGYEFECPACDKETEVLSVCGYFVRRYRVYYIKQFTYTDDWKACDIRDIEYGIYHKSGRGYGYGTENRQITLGAWRIKDFLDRTDISVSRYDDAIYSDYNLAIQQAEKFTQTSIDKVKDYNIEHGTNYPIPNFGIEHDKKSK